MSFLHHLHESSPVAHDLLVLSMVVLAGIGLGNVRVKGIKLGIAGVLFSGLLASHFGLKPETEVSHFLKDFGLVLFVYSVGVAGGPAFFASLGRAALRTGAVVLAGLCVAAAVTVALGRAMGLGGPAIAGLYAGSVTNTPALASVVEALRAGSSTHLADPVVGYSMAYPMGVLAVLLVMHLLRGAGPGERAPSASPAGLVARTARITRAEVLGRPAEALAILLREFRHLGGHQPQEQREEQDEAFENHGPAGGWQGFHRLGALDCCGGE